MSKHYNDPAMSSLESLRASLQRLKSIALPVETRSAVQDAIRDADHLAEQLASGAGQSRLAALNRVSQVLGTSLDLDEVLNQVMDAVIDLTGAERGFLVLLDMDTRELTLRAARNIEHATLDRKDMGVSQTIIRRVLETSQGVVSTDAQQDPRFAGQDSVVFFALRSVLCAPLRARGQTIGVIYVDNRAQGGIFTIEDLNLLNTFATQAAIAIENAGLYTRTDQALHARVAELETLTQIDRELNEQLDLDRTAEITRLWALKGTGASHCWLIRCEGDSTMALLGAKKEEEENELDSGIQQIIRPVLEECVTKSYLPDNGQAARLVVPVRCAGSPLFVMVVEGSQPFGELDQQYLERLAGRAAAALENATLYQAVQEANRAKSKFVSVVTHELRIPMTSIKGYTDLIRQGAVGPVNEMQQNFLGVIRNNLDRMSALVSDLADISHIETGRLKLSCKMIPILEPVQDTLNSMVPRLKEKEQSIELEVKSELSPVYTDPNRLVQALTNLINNAHKYTPTGGRIVVRLQQADEFVRIEVVDNGVGISSQDQSQLFSQFFRSDDQAVREQQGWGLGLNVAKRLVNLMGGEIGFESKLGEGSTFWFTMPTIQPSE